jgi:hypothetical protein
LRSAAPLVVFARARRSVDAAFALGFAFAFDLGFAFAFGRAGLEGVRAPAPPLLVASSRAVTCRAAARRALERCGRGRGRLASTLCSSSGALAS